jgi:hypothetical protein
MTRCRRWKHDVARTGSYIGASTPFGGLQGQYAGSSTAFVLRLAVFISGGLTGRRHARPDSARCRPIHQDANAPLPIVADRSIFPNNTT